MLWTDLSCNLYSYSSETNLQRQWSHVNFTFSLFCSIFFMFENKNKNYLNTTTMLGNGAEFLLSPNFKRHLMKRISDFQYMKSWNRLVSVLVGKSMTIAPPPRQTCLFNSLSNCSSIRRINKYILIVPILKQSIFFFCIVFFAFVIFVCRTWIKIEFEFFVQLIKKRLRCCS